METEIEAKFPDVNTEQFREILKEKGAVLEYPEMSMRRKNFDFSDGRLDRVNAWVRVRDEGNKITLSYKQLNDRTLHGTKEISLMVEDFEKICSFLEALGLEAKTYQETKREKWNFKNTEITIDTWPWVPSFVEIEGPTEEAVKSAASKLGFDWATAMHGSVETIYQMHYDFTEKEIDHWPEIRFIDAPEWLLAKKI